MLIYSINYHFIYSVLYTLCAGIMPTEGAPEEDFPYEPPEYTGPHYDDDGSISLAASIRSTNKNPEKEVLDDGTVGTAGSSMLGGGFDSIISDYNPNQSKTLMGECVIYRIYGALSLYIYIHKHTIHI